MIEYFIILLLSFPPLLWFRNGFVLLGHDSGFRFDRLAQLPNLFYSWDPKVNFGVDWSLFKGFLITQLPETLLGQKLSLLFWFASMGVGMLILLRSVFPEPKYRFFRLFTSIFYMYNFFVLSGWLIGERAKFSLFAALPIGLLLIYNVLVRNKSILRNGLLFGLLYFFLNGGGVLPLFGGTFVVLGLAFLYLGGFRIKTLKTFVTFVVPFLLLNAYYIVPNTYLLWERYGSAVGVQGGIEGLIAWERMVSRDASFWNLIRLQGIPGEFGTYQTNPILVLASLIPALVILFGVTRLRFPRIIKLLLFILPFGLLFTMGTHPPTGILYEFAMKKIPGFVMFRSSFYKFAPALWFPTIVSTGYFLNEMKPRRIVKILLIIGLLTYHYPFFTTDIFAIGNGFSTRVRVPDYVKSITEGMKQHVGQNDAVLIMPKMDDFSPDLSADMYTWGYFGIDIFPRNAVNRRFVANDSANRIVERLYNALYAGNRDGFRQLAKTLGINYVLWRGDAIPSPDSTEMAKKVLERESQVIAAGPWSLYRVGEQTNAITATSTFSGFTGTDEGEAFLVETAGTIMSPGEDFIEAECIMCRENEYAKMVDSIRLPQTRIKPGSFFFLYEKWRQKRLLDSVFGKPKGRIDVDLALALRYRSWGDSNKADDFLRNALDVWKSLSGRDKFIYAVRLKTYMEALGQPTPEELAKNIWMSEPGIYRYITPDLEGYTSSSPIKHTKEGLRFIEVRSTGPSPYVFLRKTVVEQMKGSPNVTYQKINPTKYIAEVTSDGPYMLELKEQFDPRWKISVGGEHVKVNGFANGWIIDKKGSYDVELYYAPQIYFYIGLGISIVSLIYAMVFFIR